MLEFLEFNGDDPNWQTLLKEKTQVIFVDPNTSAVRHGIAMIRESGGWHFEEIEVINYNDATGNYDYRSERIPLSFKMLVAPIKIKPTETVWNL